MHEKKFNSRIKRIFGISWDFEKNVYKSYETYYWVQMYALS
jgi:hypothetical protein